MASQLGKTISHTTLLLENSMVQVANHNLMQCPLYIAFACTIFKIFWLIISDIVVYSCKPETPGYILKCQEEVNKIFVCKEISEIMVELKLSFP